MYIDHLKQPLIIDVAELPVHRRLKAWGDVFAEAFYPLDYSDLRGDFRHGRLEMRDVDCLRIARATADAVRWRRKRTHIGSHPGGDFYLLPLPNVGMVRIDQNGRSVEVSPETLAIFSAVDGYDNAQFSPDMWSVRIPGAVLRERIPNIDDLIAVGIPAAAPQARLFLGYAHSFLGEAGSLEQRGQSAASRIFLDLLSLALLAPEMAGRGETIGRIAHRKRVLRFIESRFHDPEIALSTVAASVGISERYVQRILTERGATLTSLLRSRRIDEAKRLLALPSLASRSISSIGYAVGFSSPAHFSRTFHSAVGMSPKEFRVRSTTAGQLATRDRDG
ncbi:AraC family transcriptional regulator [Shinella sp.]|uniref:AraC family transcriptional regulator n=1 Tax=Shinella sp. TaxID=1870904 RepID=UPI0039E3529A